MFQRIRECFRESEDVSEKAKVIRALERDLGPKGDL